MKTIVILLDTVTRAVQAKKCLARLKIRSKLVKTTASEKAHGCAYGLEIESGQLYAATGALKKEEFAFEIMPWDRSF